MTTTDPEPKQKVEEDVEEEIEEENVDQSPQEPWRSGR